MFSLALSYEVVELRREELSGHDGLLEAEGSRFMSLQLQDSFQWEINECHGVIGKRDRLGDHRSSEHGSAVIRRESPWAFTYAQYVTYTAQQDDRRQTTRRCSEARLMRAARGCRKHEPACLSSLTLAQ